MESVEDRNINDKRYAINDAKLRALGWAPERQWAEGIKETIEWYKNLPEEQQEAFGKLQRASQRGELEVLKSVLPVHPHLLNVRHPENKQTLVLNAAWKGHLNIVQHLVSLKADLEIPDQYGQSPAFVAADEGHVECLTVLLAAV